MARITALRENKKRDRVNIFLDGKFAFSLSAELADKESLECDQIVTDDRIDALTGSDRRQRCLKVATNFLSYRPRSVAELRTKLRSRGFDSETQDSVLASLKTMGLLDDAAFADFWTGNRQSFSPRSRRLTRIELQRRGVASEVIDQAVATIDDEASAYEAAIAHVRSIRWADRDQFRRRLGGFLQRRGFTYSVVDSTLKRVWTDMETDTSAHSAIEDIN